MIERFNFYDVYGYLIPGFALVALLWLPFLLFDGLPAVGFGDAIGAVFAAYLVGHLLYSVTALAFPSGRRVSPDDIRRPSDDFLDPDQNKHADQIIRKLTARAKDEFGIDLDAASTEPELVKLRREVFLLFRAKLVVNGKGLYAEQFEGMYSMMRGTSCAAFLAAINYFGWFSARWDNVVTEPAGSWRPPTWLISLLLGFVILDFFLNGMSARSGKVQAGTQGVAVSRNRFWSLIKNWHLIVFGCLIGAAWYAGKVAGEVHWLLGSQRSMLAMFGAILLFAASRFYKSYQYFTKHFALTVYRDYLALPAAGIQPPK
jgi:hypothetical protein